MRKTYKFVYFKSCKTEPVFPPEALKIATEADRADLEAIGFFEDGEIDEFLEKKCIYILREKGKYVGLGTLLFPTWRSDIADAGARDIGMHVAEIRRGRGIGRSIVQNLIAICIENGYIPTAECYMNNKASRATLESAGFVIKREVEA